MILSLLDWIHHDRLSASGEKGSSRCALTGYLNNRVKGTQPLFPPQMVVAVKTLTHELPYKCGIPLSRFSTNEIYREVVARGIVAQISGTTLWR